MAPFYWWLIALVNVIGITSAYFDSTSVGSACAFFFIIFSFVFVYWRH